MEKYIAAKFRDIYPRGFYRLIENKLVKFDAWEFFTAEESLIRRKALRGRYRRKLVPFAYSLENDDIACFEYKKPNTVQLIHDYADAGWEQRREFVDIWEFMIYVAECMAERNREEEEGALENE